MRTDSTRISPVAQNEAANFIVDRFGEKYSKHGSRVKNASGAQDAHEAIRPSSVFNTPESIAKYLDKDQLKLYTLIWNRFVASQMTAAVFDTMNVRLGQNGVQYTACLLYTSSLIFPQLSSKSTCFMNRSWGKGKQAPASFLYRERFFYVL